jgi:hypothetical protein
MRARGHAEGVFHGNWRMNLLVELGSLEEVGIEES